jgi:hypothetical protein
MSGFVVGMKLMTPALAVAIEYAHGVRRRALAQATAKRLHARSPRTFRPLWSILTRLSRVDPPDQVEGIDQKQAGTPLTLVSQSSC